MIAVYSFAEFSTAAVNVIREVVNVSRDLDDDLAEWSVVEFANDVGDGGHEYYETALEFCGDDR